MEDIPKGAQYKCDGLFYRKGIHSLVYVHIFGDWIKCDKPWYETV